MRASSLLPLLALPVLASAATLEPRRKCHASSTVDANYDDLTFLPALPLANSISNYKGLTYNAFVGLSTLPAAQTGIVPHSGSNTIVTGAPQTLTSGTAYIKADPSAGTTYFDLRSFYFACAVDSVSSAVGIPTACTVSIKGYYQGKLHATQEFDYKPDGMLIAHQQKAGQAKGKCHTGFMGVDKVEFTTDNPTLQVLLLDDLEYIPHSCT